MNKYILILALFSFVLLVGCTQQTTTTSTTTANGGEVSCLVDPTQSKCIPTEKIYDVEETDNVVYVKKGEDFKILQLPDLHLSANTSDGYGNGKPKETYNFIKRLVYLTQPDMIVLTGDNLFGCSTLRAKELTELLDSFQIPWTFTWGNHDTHTQSIEEKITMETEFLKSKYCLYRNDYENTTLKRRGDHVVQLRQEGTNKLLYAFYLIDSGTHDGSKYESVYSDQLTQFKNVINGLDARYQEQIDNKHSKLPNLLFQHIAIQEYNDAYTSYEMGKSELLFGKKLETPCPGLENTGQFSVMQELNTKGMFVGHDHVNTFGIMYKGILLAVGGQTGYSNSYYLNYEEPKNGLLITINSECEMSAKLIY